VAVLVPWEILGPSWQRRNLEVIVLQCIESVDAFLVVQTKQAFEEVETFWLQMAAKALIDVASFLLPILLALATGQRKPAWHVGFVGRTDELEDPNTLIYVCTSFENRLSLEHLTKDASMTCQ
jgi:hypothetical protein